MEQRPLKKFIVITSIFNPTQAIESFAALKDYQLIVVGDKKTPANWSFENCTYINVEDQLSLSPSLANAIPFNHYGRKMLGYVYAMQQGADVIIDTDDDNTQAITDFTFDAATGKAKGKFTLSGLENSTDKSATVTGDFEVVAKKEVE
jgi:hypothetical protein